MKFLILGSGKMGYALAYDLIRSEGVKQVILADSNTKNLKHATKLLIDKKVIPVSLDVNNQDETLEIMKFVDVVVSCLPYNFNLQVASMCLIANRHFLDLGGNEDVLRQQFELNDLAKKKNVIHMPDLGLAPGLVSLIALTEANNMDELYEIKIRVGGIPIEPKEPLNYCKLFSVNGLINEYVEDCVVIKDGHLFKLPALTECETIDFVKPFGEMEAFYTAGNVNNLFNILKGKIKHLNYKTIRYPGHCAQMNLLKTLGLMSSVPIKVNKHNVVPRDLLHNLLDKALPDNEPDAVLIRINVTGVKNSKPVEVIWECVDLADEVNNISAMMRMTAFPTSIIAQMVAKGEIDQSGVLVQEKTVPLDKLINELAVRGINITRQQRSPVVA